MSNKNIAPTTYLTPIYLQLREIIRNKIEDGEYLPGTAIPSENELAETYGINRITVRNAVEALAKEGMLTRVQGKGVFVIGTKVEHELDEMTGFISVFSDKNKPHIKIREISKEIRPAGDKYASIFNISPDDSIYSIQQLFISEGSPVAYDEVFIPSSILPPLENIASSVFNFLDIFAFYNIKLEYIQQSLEIVKATPKIIKLLETNEKVAIMRMDFTCFDESGATLEYGHHYVRSDKYNFLVHLYE